jgi:hypothetical protein
VNVECFWRVRVFLCSLNSIKFSNGCLVLVYIYIYIFMYMSIEFELLPCGNEAQITFEGTIAVVVVVVDMEN